MSQSLRLLFATVSVMWIALTFAAAGCGGQAAADRTKKAKESWAAILDEDARINDREQAEAVASLNCYFDEVALPHVPDFLGEFSGLLDGDTPVFVYRRFADNVGWRGYSGRSDAKLKRSLEVHLQFPNGLNRSLADTIECYYVLQQQRDSVLRDKAYEVLRGAGIKIDKSEIEAIFAMARDDASRAGFDQATQESVIDFGWLAAGKEGSMLAVQPLLNRIVARAMVSVGARMGIVIVGAGAASATEAASDASVVGAVPGKVVVVAELALTFLVDWLVGSWLESRAATKLGKELDEIRNQIAGELQAYMTQYETGLRERRDAALVELLKKP